VTKSMSSPKLDASKIAAGIMVAQQTVRRMGLTYNEGRVVFSVLSRLMETPRSNKTTSDQIASLCEQYANEETIRVENEIL
jgi:hypothetical protein